MSVWLSAAAAAASPIPLSTSSENSGASIFGGACTTPVSHTNKLVTQQQDGKLCLVLLARLNNNGVSIHYRAAHKGPVDAAEERVLFYLIRPLIWSHSIRRIPVQQPVNQLPRWEAHLLIHTAPACNRVNFPCQPKFCSENTGIYASRFLNHRTDILPGNLMSLCRMLAKVLCLVLPLKGV